MHKNVLSSAQDSVEKSALQQASKLAIEAIANIRTVAGLRYVVLQKGKLLISMAIKFSFLNNFHNLALDFCMYVF